ncbi:unnamed protein product [Protopolystoma xenopodis]|uniref:Uncharacterized protein n=1 Tax=Protopolystoma xenopodis TaxID=117903 RepID=A0A3S5B7D6_9PLAT|nr:unnamed protein product [Protopolystoma xenopodis]
MKQRMGRTGDSLFTSEELRLRWTKTEYSISLPASSAGPLPDSDWRRHHPVSLLPQSVGTRLIYTTGLEDAC